MCKQSSDNYFWLKVFFKNKPPSSPSNIFLSFHPNLKVCWNLFSSELKELVEKQSEVIVKIQGKLEEFGKNFESTSTDLEETKLENKKLKEELHSQDAKFEDMCEMLQQEDKDILCSLMKQKVDIDSHEEAFKRFRELLCEEENKNKILTNNLTNFSQNINGKVDDVSSKIENIALTQVHYHQSFSNLFSRFYVSVKDGRVNGVSQF